MRRPPALRRAGAAWRWPLSLALALLLAGCATLPRTPFGVADQATAQPIGFPGVRFDADNAAQARAFNDRFQAGPVGSAGDLDVLALSGGGAQGAYGAGVLVGWTEAGRRPTFSVVTGVSTGALIAPFAFLGPEWDDRLQAAFTGGEATHLLRRRGLGALFAVGLYSPAPLRRLVESYVDDAMMAAVARENAKGRRLLVATTNLDTQQSVIWDLGAIAARGGPRARALFVDILVASASVPGAFPSVLIPVENRQGYAFQEMHVDGGTSTPFFAVPEALLTSRPYARANRHVRVYVILNSRFESTFAVTRRNTLSIAYRAFDTMQRAAIRISISATEAFCLRNQLECRFADLPPAPGSKGFLDFSSAAMRELFRLGESGGRSGTAWRLTPAT